MVKKRPILILVDTGSTRSFLNPQTAKETGYAIQEDVLMRVTVADGNCIMSLQRYNDFKWKVDEIEFTDKMRILKLGGCDVVLEAD